MEDFNQKGVSGRFKPKRERILTSKGLEEDFNQEGISGGF